MKKVLLIFAILLALANQLTGCGLRGPLYSSLSYKKSDKAMSCSQNL